MNNIMLINSHKAVVQYDSDIDMFRGEFTELNAGADFYSQDIEGLKQEGATSLRVFMKACADRGIEPCKKYSGTFSMRVPKILHANISTAAAAEGKSLNQWVVDTLSTVVHV